MHPNSLHARAALSTKTSSLHRVRTTTTTRRYCTSTRCPVAQGDLFVPEPLRVASWMMAARVGAAGGTSSARRRRERRLRSWAKHEWLSVAMALAEKLHSANRTVLPMKEVEQHYALRGQKPARARHAVPFRWRRERAGANGGASTAGSGSAAHRGAEGRAHAVRADPRRSWRNRLSKCPSCRVLRVLPARLVWNRRWRNNWWMCRRCCRMPCPAAERGANR